jgi:hypothetical protein
MDSVTLNLEGGYLGGRGFCEFRLRGGQRVCHDPVFSEKADFPVEPKKLQKRNASCRLEPFPVMSVLSDLFIDIHDQTGFQRCLAVRVRGFITLIFLSFLLSLVVITTLKMLPYVFADRPSKTGA